MNSRIIPVAVEHERLLPKRHFFRYRLFVFAFDLSELDDLDRTNPLFGHNRTRLLTLRDADYLERGDASIADKLRRLPSGNGRSAGALDPDEYSDIVLVTAPGLLNYVFNPVSFYFLHGAAGRDDAHIAEVNNTFGEKHVYALQGAEGVQDGRALYHRPKSFHVSPFNNMQGNYRFEMGDPKQGLDVRIELERDERVVFRASMQADGPAMEANTANTARMLLRRPLFPQLTFPRILHQAAKLYVLKGLGVHRKPKPAGDMTLRSSLKNEAASTAAYRPAKTLDAAAAWAADKTFSRFGKGSFTVAYPNGTRRRFGGLEPGADAEFLIRDDRFFRSSVLGGDIGFGDAYAQGYWDAPDLRAVFDVFLDNRDRLPLTGASIVPGVVRQLRRLFYREAAPNTRDGSRRNISAHYDLSNEMFAVFLDPTMAYSSGFWNNLFDPLEDLETAQRNKFERMARKLDLQPGDEVLEIGCGWGGFAAHIAEKHGCRVTATTISNNQYEYVSDLVRRRGLSDAVKVVFSDYRDLKGAYDKIVSIEMLEAVGHKNHGRFFSAVDALLKPEGLAGLQVITIADQQYDDYRRQKDWIRKRIFPGGLLPSLERMCRVMRRKTDLAVQDVENIAAHYARTLVEWRRRFAGNRDKLLELGLDEPFMRAWEYYFTFCEAGFASGNINDLQLVLAKPNREAAAKVAAGTRHCLVSGDPGRTVGRPTLP